MATTRRVPLFLALLGLVAAALVLLAPSPAGARPVGTLRVSRSQAVAGEHITFRGRLPTKVRRPVVLQRRLGSWLDVKRFRTDRRGRFSVVAPLNGMPTNPYRVFAKRVKVRRKVYPAVATPTRTISTLDEDVQLTTTADRTVTPQRGVNLREAKATPGQKVTITAASVGVTPANRTVPVGVGRSMTLQMRNADDTWSNVGSSATANAGGKAAFTITAPNADYVVYRVVGGATRGGLTPFPSFPLYLWVKRSAPTRAAQGTDPITGSPVVLKPQPGPISTASTFKWGNAVENYSWEEGEAITPTWTDYSNGTGRVTNYVAMLALDSGVQDGRYRSWGDISSTLNSSGHQYGRWEMRVRAPIFAQSGKNYRLRLQLVPSGSPPSYTCDQAITLGRFTGYSNSTTLGANNAGQSWSMTTNGQARNRYNWHTYAVEVTPTRISWFIDAKVVATLKNSGAYSGQSLVPRLAMDGAGDQAWMNRTKLTADWVRYFSLARPDARSTAAPAPTQGTFSGGC